jgi:hypothetical protein
VQADHPGGLAGIPQIGHSFIKNLDSQRVERNIDLEQASRDEDAFPFPKTIRIGASVA